VDLKEMVLFNDCYYYYLHKAVVVGLKTEELEKKMIDLVINGKVQAKVDLAHDVFIYLFIISYLFSACLYSFSKSA
jgi:hypothetical protein